jgi:hypothetical protein
MRSPRSVAGVIVAGVLLVLSACTATPGVADIAMDANDVRGEVVEIAVQQVLYIDTSDLEADIESFTAEIADESIVEFERGHNAGDFAVYPSFTALRSGSTEVTMTAGTDIPPLVFTVQVTGDGG